MTFFAGVALAFFGLLQLLRGFSALFAPVSNDYSEMMVAGMAQQWLATGRLEYIYAPPNAPYGMPGVQYPPLFIGLSSLLMAASGLGPVLATRLLAWAGYAAAGAMVGLLVWRETGNRRGGLIAAFFPFIFWSVLIFINGARPDPLALFLSLLGVYVYRSGRQGSPLAEQCPTGEGKAEESPLAEQCPTGEGKAEESPLAEQCLTDGATKGLVKPPRYGRGDLGRLVLVAFILVMAFYSKQTYLAAAAAIGFDLLLTRGWRLQAIFFGVSYAAFGLIGFGLWQFWSNGTFVGIFEPERAGRFIFHLAPAMVGFFLLDHAAMIIIALGTLFWQWKRGQRFWSLYFLFAALACSSIVKDGAVDYYFNELAYLISIQVGIALVQSSTHRATLRAEFKVQRKVISRQSSVFSRRKILGPRSSFLVPTQNRQLSIPPFSSFLVPRSSFLLLLLIQVLVAAGMLVAWNQWRDNDNFGEVYKEAQVIVQEYQHNGREALVFQNNFLIETGQTELIGDYFIYWILIGNGHRDITPLLTDLQTRRYEMILVGSPEFRRWSPELEQALTAGYDLRIMTGKDGRQLYWLYRRRS